MNIVLGVTGSIAAYKAADIISKLKKLGHDIDVILTESGSRIITPITLQTLSKNKVYMDMFEEIDHKEVKHISLADKADVVLIAPRIVCQIVSNCDAVYRRSDNRMIYPIFYLFAEHVDSRLHFSQAFNILCSCH